MTDTNHAVQNANGWADTIRELVAALKCDYERLQELRDERESLQGSDDLDALHTWDTVRERIQESPLSVEVRSGWCASKADMAPEEFCILLSTGGPALRILGELDEHGQPSRAWLEYQDWGTPWTHHYVEGLGDALLTFAQQFYFGE